MPKVAIVHDDFMQWGGAERVVATLAEIYPDAPIYTPMLDPRVVAQSGIDLSRFRTSWLDRLPAKKWLNKVLFPLYPYVFEAFNFDEFDLVISSTARYAHGIITKPHTRHIANVNSPFRGFWDPAAYFANSFVGRIQKFLLAPLLLASRKWDYIAGQRSDQLVANSKTVQKRIAKYWRRESTVIYPFVDVHRFKVGKKPQIDLLEEYFLVVSRLVNWKKPELAVQACAAAGVNLVVVGDGPGRDHLVQIAGPRTQLTGYLGDQEVTYLMKHAKALIHPQKEDFGMTVVEANACGTPVIAFAAGGALETVIDGKNGVFFHEQNVESLVQVLQKFNQTSFSSPEIIEHANQFSRDRFIVEWQEYVARTH